MSTLPCTDGREDPEGGTASKGKDSSINVEQ